MKIPFGPPNISEKEIKSVKKVLKSNWLSMGKKTIDFENQFSKYIGSKYAIAVNSCTSALFLSLKANGINKGDEIITTPFTFAATANTIIHCGASPIFTDIEDITYNINPYQIEEKITKKTKAIIVVHYGGRSVNMKEISKIARNYNLTVIEDAAHSTGSYYPEGNKIGSKGNLTCFSFYPTKPMTTGEGGMITINNKQKLKKIKLLRLHGINSDAWNRYSEKKMSWYYEVVDAGYKFNMTDINAVIGIEQLKKLDYMNIKRKKITEYYNNGLKQLDVITPKIINEISSYHLYPIRLKTYNRDKFIQEMGKKGIDTSVHFIPLYLMPYYKKVWKYKKEDFPKCQKVFKNIVSLPIYPQLNKTQLNFIVTSIKEILEE